MKQLLQLIMALLFSSLAFGQSFYDINTVNEIEITFEQSNWDQLLDQLAAAGEERLLGSVSINGEVFDSVGVRYKGNSSYSANQVKNPFNIKLDYIIDDQEIEGYGTLKLSNGKNDPSFVREVLSYEIARKYFPASQSNYCNVYVNGQHLGLYTSNQDVDKYFMRTHFQSDENARIKGEVESGLSPNEMGGVWEYFGTDSSDYFHKYTLESDFGWNTLVDFLDVLNNDNDNVEDVLNIDRHLWFLAFQNVLVNLDGPINNPQNYYMYNDGNGQMNPIPWDFNESFGVFSMLQSSGQLNTYQLQQLDPFTNINENDYPIIGKVLSDPIYRKMYVAHYKTILAENFENSWYEDRAYEIQDIIDEDVQADQNKFYTYSNFLNNVNSSVGGGPQSVIGITQLMDSRISYLNSYDDFEYIAPVISEVAHTPEQPEANSVLWFSTTVEDADEVYLSYRFSHYSTFTKTLMFDDGAHEDGQANDGVYGVSINIASSDLEYYIYAENDDAAAFMPVKAEYEFYNISVSSDLVINEFMADNESTVTDQDGEYDDWIELYNNSNSTIELEGFYLSDDAAEPDMWAFPDTNILAGDYLIIWADKDEEQAGLHADLKLSSSGESLFLYDNDLNVIDQVTFTEQKSDTTYGRYPNGTGDFAEMMPTFGEENEPLIMAISNLESSNSGFQLAQNIPNPFTHQTQINIELEKAGYVSLAVYNMYGQLIETLEAGEKQAGKYSYQWNADNNKTGVYLYQLQFEGQTLVKKMLVQ